MATNKINGVLWAAMVRAGAANLHLHVDEVNDLNVFPIPDGDTGENMMLTMQGGVSALTAENEDLSAVADAIAEGMLLGARGNSGVILSQFFAGIAEGLHTYADADARAFEKAIACGVGCAFESVMTPTEGTILTVMKDAGCYAGNCNCESLDLYFEALIAEAHRSLARTPELLPILKEAGVVDSGGAGLIYVLEGMYEALCGHAISDDAITDIRQKGQIDPSLFGEDDVMEFGYCTELLLRLQTCKTAPTAFDVGMLTEYLQTIGDSVVAVKNGSIVKLHVHTMTPYRVLEFCQRYGEFLTVKIENMMLQHNDTVAQKETLPAFTDAVRERRRFGVVSVATGDGICRAFEEMGADEVIYGGQTNNPSAEDFLGAIDRVNADTVFVLPNNGNVLLAARQAAQICKSSDVRVIPTHSIGDGYAVLSMLDLDCGNADEIEAAMNESMDGVLTAEVSRSIRDAELNGVKVRAGEYIGIMGKRILASGSDRENIACTSIDALDPASHGVVLIIRGKGVAEEDARVLSSYIQKTYPLTEVCEADGGQEVYDYILVAE